MANIEFNKEDVNVTGGSLSISANQTYINEFTGQQSIDLITPSAGSSIKISSAWLDTNTIGNYEIQLEFVTTGSLIWKTYGKAAGGNEQPNSMPINIVGSETESVKLITDGINATGKVFVVINWEEI